MKRLLVLLVSFIMIFSMIEPSPSFESSGFPPGSQVGNEVFNYTNPSTDEVEYMGYYRTAPDAALKEFPYLYLELYRILAITTHDIVQVNVPSLLQHQPYLIGRDEIRAYIQAQYPNLSSADVEQCMQVLAYDTNNTQDPNDDTIEVPQSIEISLQDFYYHYHADIYTIADGYGRLWTGDLNSGSLVERIIYFSVAENTTNSNIALNYRVINELRSYDLPGVSTLGAYCREYLLTFFLVHYNAVNPVEHKDYLHPCGETCTICGDFVPEENRQSHVYDTYKLSTDGSGHYSACICGELKFPLEFTSHTTPYIFGSWTDNLADNNEKRLCSYCNYPEYRSHNPENRQVGWIENSQEFLCGQRVVFCTDCGHIYESVNITEHEYPNCATTKCNNCDYNRPSAGVPSSDGHVYDDYCLGTQCNRCGHTRTALQHVPVLDTITFVEVGTEGVCHEFRAQCQNCLRTFVVSSISDHLWSNCADTYCDTCNYHRSDVSGILYSDGHVYDNCLDPICNRCINIRTPPGHSAYTQYWWANTSTASACQTYYGQCGICGETVALGTNPIHTYIHPCTDLMCSVCGYNRGTAPGHSYTYSWVDVGTAGTCKKYVGTCSSCGYSYISTYDYTHAYINCTDTTCNDCGYVRVAPDHTYTNCVDATCNVCGNTRTAPGHSAYTQYWWANTSTASACQTYYGQCGICGETVALGTNPTHSYIHPCTDLMCYVCGYNRGSAPGHSYTYSWVDVCTAGTCEKYVGTCSDCGYSYILAYDYTHAYTNCTDTTCNDCGYVRVAPGHSYTYSWVDVSTAGTCEKYVGTCSNCGYSYISTYDYTHAYTNCTDSVCNDCGYTRTAPGHVYTYGAWTDVSTEGICEKQLRSCNNCSYSYWYYDYSHAWSNACDTRCNDCAYTRSITHNYSYSWVDVRTASICEKLVATCTICGYSYIVSYDYTHAYTDQYDTTCNDCGYIR